MLVMNRWLIIIFFFYSGNLNASILLYQIPAFFNFQKETSLDFDPKKEVILNPRMIQLSEFSDADYIKKIKEEVHIEAFRGENIYTSFVIEAINKDHKISANLLFEKEEYFNQNNTEISLVSSWFQSGRNTTISKNNQYLTHELLIKDDLVVDLSDRWVKSKEKWFYQPPKITQSESIKSSINQNDTRRLLVEVNVPDSIPAGTYTITLLIESLGDEEVFKKIALNIDVKDISLNYNLKDVYDLFIYTKLALDLKVGRENSFNNGQHNVGDDDYQRENYFTHANQIEKKGFNGVFIMDWRPSYVEDALDILNDVGLDRAIIYGRPVVKKGVDVLTVDLVNTIESKGFEPIFYGYDEPGGNKKVKQQLALNSKLHNLGAKSINAIFWNDIPNIEKNISNRSENFDYLTVSMGSNGNRKFFESLPILKRENNIRLLAYWHPHVENPMRNRLFMGFWLWASGLDGVSPHAYYILPHIARYNKEGLDESRGRLSPYNDFSMWDNPNGIFRQHSTIYPIKKGFISTLQWEAISEGVTDLVMLKQLEKLIENDRLKIKAEKGLELLQEIRSNVLTLKTSSFSDRQIKKFNTYMNEWRNQIRKLIMEYNKELNY